MKLKIMSFNTLHCENYLTREIDFDIFAKTIKESGADIIGLNEIRGEGKDADYQAQAKILGEKTGYYYYFAKALDVGGVNPYGNALLSRYPIISAETIFIPDPDPSLYTGYHERRCVLKAKIDVGEEITVLVAHFGLKNGDPENGVATILKERSATKCIAMGDFNVEPDNEVLLPLRQELKDAADLFTEELKSFPSDAPEIKIDYIFCSKDVEIVSADIPDIVVSDHRPHIAEIII